MTQTHTNFWLIKWNERFTRSSLKKSLWTLYSFPQWLQLRCGTKSFFSVCLLHDDAPRLRQCVIRQSVNVVKIFFFHAACVSSLRMKKTSGHFCQCFAIARSSEMEVKGVFGRNPHWNHKCANCQTGLNRDVGHKIIRPSCLGFAACMQIYRVFS